MEEVIVDDLLDKIEKVEPVYSVTLMRIVYNEPIAIHTSFLRENIFPDIAETGSEITSMYSFFSHHGYAGFQRGMP